MSSLSKDIAAASKIPGEHPWYMYVAIAALSSLTAIVGLTLRYLNKKHAQEISERNHIRSYDIKLREFVVSKGQNAVQAQRKKQAQAANSRQRSATNPSK